MKQQPLLEAPAPSQDPVSLHAPVWWGNTLTMTIEGAGFAILVITYFYIRRGFPSWPPAKTLLPDLGVSTANVAILVISVLPMWYAAKLAVARERLKLIAILLLVCAAFGITASVFRVLEFRAVNTRWNSNAYGAIVWSILAVHFAHILAATLQTLVTGILLLTKPVEERRYTDINANAIYWYFVALSWVGLYFIVFLGPRFL